MKTQFKEQQTANPLIYMIFIRLVLLLWVVFQNLKSIEDVEQPIA